MTTPTILSQSAIKDFQTCRKRYDYRFERGLVPKTTPIELTFGSAVHDGLQAHHLGRDEHIIEDVINQKAVSEPERINALAMLTGYRAKYPTEDFEVLALEQEFRLPLKHHDQSVAQTHDDFVRGGKLDGVIRRPDGVWLMEHKTAAKIDAAYLQKLWLDFQITWYGPVVEDIFGEPLRGVLYNVIKKLAKKEFHPVVGETDEEWDARYEAAKNKKLLKRKLSEGPAAYAERIFDAYRDPEMYHREEILLDRRLIDTVQREGSQIADDIRRARVFGSFYRNTESCFKWSKPCAYLPICQNLESPVIIENNYDVKPPHEELNTSMELSF